MSVLRERISVRMLALMAGTLCSRTHVIALLDNILMKPICDSVLNALVNPNLPQTTQQTLTLSSV